LGGGGGVDVRTKNVGIWLWGWVLFLSLFPLILFSLKAALRPWGLRDARRDRIRESKKSQHLRDNDEAQKKALVLKKNGLGAIGDLF